VAALFGLVKSSGVVGVDEKYVLVPKNDKPAAKMKRWMYVYFAVDVYTYDLLPLAIYAHNDQTSAQAFLLAVRAKGAISLGSSSPTSAETMGATSRGFFPKRSITNVSSTPSKT
jgi:hypothetical protein